jgi:hypothetical protein
MESRTDKHFLLSNVVMNRDRRDKGCEGGLQASSKQFFVAREDLFYKMTGIHYFCFQASNLCLAFVVV